MKKSKEANRRKKKIKRVRRRVRRKRRNLEAREGLKLMKNWDAGVWVGVGKYTKNTKPTHINADWFVVDSESNK